MKKLCGLSLNTAAVVIGSLYLIIFLYVSIHTTHNLITYLGKERQLSSEWFDNFDNAYFYSLWVFLSVASLIASIFLIVGGEHNNHKFLIPWLIVGVLVLIALALCLLYCSYIVIANKSKLEAIFVVVFGATAAIFALKIYLWRGIYQLYNNITDHNERMKILPTTVPLYVKHYEFK